MKLRWKPAAAGALWLAALLWPAPLVAQGTGEATITEPIPLPTDQTWNVGKQPLDWDALKGKVVVVDFWNWH